LNVTVVTPTFNRAKLIQRALDSVRQQRRRPAEVIVVDDCSSDGTPQIARDWAERHGVPLRLEILPKNSGPAVARNRGIQLANTAYVAFLDSDDEHHSETLEQLCAALDAHPEAVLSFGDATVITPNARLAHGLFATKADATTVAEPLPHDRWRLRDATDLLLQASIIPTSAVCFRRQAALSAGCMPERYRSGEDWLFFLRMSQQGQFVFTRNDVALHHRHADNLTGPRAGEFMAREKLRGLLELADGSLGIQLSQSQIQRVVQLQAVWGKHWRYHLSQFGWSRYWQGLRGPLGVALGGWPAQMAADPKSVLRALTAKVGFERP